MISPVFARMINNAQARYFCAGMNEPDK